jgi:cytochrome c biogenesis protein CcmG, thiol:disulfide interchange protein DsbE
MKIINRHIKGRRLKAKTWLPILMVLGLLVYVGRAQAALRIGDILPSFTFSGINGGPVRVPDNFRGKVIVFHFWTIGCSSCLEEMPAMNGLYGTYHNKGLEILAVNVGQRKETVKTYAAELKVFYPILIDPDLKSAGTYGITDVPRTYLIDRNGVIKYRILGSVQPGVLKKLILSLL